MHTGEAAGLPRSESRPMKAPDSTLKAAISVALKSASKDLRKAFNDRDWMVREKAGHALADLVAEALHASFEIEMKPPVIPPARSRATAEETLREVFPEHDAEEAMAVVRKTVQ